MREAKKVCNASSRGEIKVGGGGGGAEKEVGGGSFRRVEGGRRKSQA